MKNALRIVFATCMFCLLVTVTYSIERNPKRITIDNKSVGMPLYFHGTVKNFSKGDLISIIFYRNKISSATGITTDTPFTHSYHYRIGVKDDGTFYVKIPAIDHVAVMDVSIIRKGKYFQINNNYLVDPGDNINFKIELINNKPSVFYSGKNSLKYRLSDKYFLHPQQRIADYCENENNQYDRYSDTGLEMRMECYRMQKQKTLLELSAYINKLSSDVYLIMVAEAKAASDFLTESLLGDTYLNQNPTIEIKNKIKYQYLQKYGALINVDNQVLALSEPYMDLIISKATVDLSLSLGRRATMPEVINELKSKYTGAILDKVVGMVLLDAFVNENGWYFMTYTPVEYQNCMEDAKKYVQTPYILAAINAQAVLNKGVDAYNFNLPDTSGNIVTLAALKGKVLLIDCWYTGCTGCALFYKYFTDSLEPSLAKDTSFLMVSICADKDETTWKNSINSGRYTNPKHLNLLAKGGYNSSDFFKYYNPPFMPFIFVVDKKGKIFLRVTDLRFKKSELDAALVE